MLLIRQPNGNLIYQVTQSNWNYPKGTWVLKSKVTGVRV